MTCISRNMGQAWAWAHDEFDSKNFNVNLHEPTSFYERNVKQGERNVKQGRACKLEQDGQMLCLPRAVERASAARPRLSATRRHRGRLAALWCVGPECRMPRLRLRRGASGAGLADRSGTALGQSAEQGSAEFG
ncbi:unnamed protein product [Symbiodinium natans]|uniref:Uncharacterized protein n=1 Tax=Symbiodinium natans TaxID=878477 RepID=A0A812QWA0_9DINO|nr:unnamed protein product [Symbiodinium natans]